MSRPTQHLPALDGLRAWAILLVLWHHGPVLFEAPGALYQQRLWRWSASGWMGVDLFFVISGFLITGILVDTRDSPAQLRTFWARRALRIFPAAYLYLAVLAATVQLVGVPPLLVGFQEWRWFVFYAANLRVVLRGWVDGSLAILWSLAIEEQFYAVWPPVVRLLSSPLLAALCVALAVGGPIVRAYTWGRSGYPAVYVATWCRIDTMAWGALLAVALRSRLRGPVLAACRWLALPSLALVAWSIAKPFGRLWPGQYPAYFPVWGYTWLAAAFAVLVGLTVEPGRVVRGLLANPVLRYLGRISYGLYLWHFLVGQLLQRRLDPWLGRHQATEAKVALWVLASVAAASLSWFAFERPILRWKDRLRFRAPAPLVEPARQVA